MADRRTTATRPAPPRGLMKERAYDEIKRRLLNDDYPAGSFLSERQLAEHLGMSKTPVKAALERLELEGFIRVSPQQGIVVRELGVRDVAEHYQLRAALEAFVLRTVAGKLTAAQKAELIANLDAQRAVRGTADVAAGVALDVRFHALFPEFLGNREILRVLAHRQERMRLVVARAFHLDPARLDGSVAEHAAIADAVLAGDGPRAAALLEDHLEVGRRCVLAVR